MNHPLLSFGALAGCLLLAVTSGAPAFAQGSALQPSPGEGAPSEASSSTGQGNAEAPTPGSLTPAQLYEHVRRGVVAILRSGSPAAVGTVLAGDGRILTALSGLGGGQGTDVRYADGTIVHAKLGRSDKGIDLALLEPESNRWTEGLRASELDPAGLDIRAMLPAPGARLGPAFASLKGRTDAHTKQGEPLMPMFAVDVRGLPMAGAPLLDATGSVVAVLVKACKGGARAGASCQLALLGAPVAAIRSFLAQEPPAPAAAPAVSAPPPAPWLGVRVQREDGTAAGTVKGVRVVAIAPSSPAAQAGIKAASDEIVAVEGQPIATPEALAAQITRHAPGDSVKLLVFGGGGFRQVTVALRAAPAETN